MLEYEERFRDNYRRLLSSISNAISIKNINCSGVYNVLDNTGYYLVGAMYNNQFNTTGMILSGPSQPSRGEYTINSYILRFLIPGVTKKDISVELNNSKINVYANTSDAVKEKVLAAGTHYNFVDNIPEGYDLDSAQAEFKNGVLIVSFEKNPVQSRKVQVF